MEVISNIVGRLVGWLPVCLFDCLPGCLFACLFACSFVCCLFVCLSVCLFACLFVYLFVCLFLFWSFVCFVSLWLKMNGFVVFFLLGANAPENPMPQTAADGLRFFTACTPPLCPHV